MIYANKNKRIKQILANMEYCLYYCIMKMTKSNIKMIAAYVSDNSTWGWTKRAAKSAKVTTQTVRNFLNGIGYSNAKLLTWFIKEYEELKETDRLINDK